MRINAKSLPILTFVLFLILLASCAKRTGERRLFAFCEIDAKIGSSSFYGYLKISSENQKVEIEFLGPFGNHLFSINLEGNKLSVLNGGENFEPEDFPFDLTEMVRDLFLALDQGNRGKKYSLFKDSYIFTYDYTKSDPRVCFDKADNSICLTVLGEKRVR